MIFAFVEDGTLAAYATSAEAIQRWEGIDVESGTVRFYDESGAHLQPRFTVPNRSGKLPGLLGRMQSGTYDLIPNPGAEVDSFALALHEARVLQPNPWFSSLEQLKAALSAKRVPVEFQAEET